MASPPPPPGPPAWSVAVRLKHRCGLEMRAAAENVLPGWGRGGERLSLLFRFRRRLILAVTSQCGTQPGSPPRGCKILRFLRSRWARLPRVASIWRRKKHPPARAAAAPRGRRAQWVQQQSRTLTRPGFLATAWTPASAATLRFAVAALAVVVVSVAVFRITGGLGSRRGVCDGDRIARWAKLLELMENPPPCRKYKWLLGVPKRGMEWIFS